MSVVSGGGGAANIYHEKERSLLYVVGEAADKADGIGVVLSFEGKGKLKINQCCRMCH
jgi:hypothetical protein